MIVHFTAMTTLANRLKKVQTEVPNKVLIDMPLSELAQEKISFGKKHPGKTFQQVWDTDQVWIQWFASHYPDSSNYDHRKFLMFVEKKVQELESTGETVPKTSGEAEGITQMPLRPKAKMIPKAKSQASTHMVPFEDDFHGGGVRCGQWNRD